MGLITENTDIKSSLVGTVPLGKIGRS